MAAADFGIDLTQSFVIGDRTSDIIAGQSVCCRSDLVKEDTRDRKEGVTSVRPDYMVENFYEAATMVKMCLEIQFQRVKDEKNGILVLTKDT